MAAEDHWPNWRDTSTSNGDTTRALLGEYGEHGAWARHYSTVRMTLGTFFLTASIGIIFQRWDKSFDWRTVGLAACALLTGIALFLLFSWLTYRSMNRQRAIVKDYRTKYGATKDLPEPYLWWRRWDVLGIVIGAVVFSVIAGLLWRGGPPKQPLVAGPPPARYAITYSAVHQTNHGREAHTFLVDETTGHLWQMRCTTDDTAQFKRIQREGESVP